MRTQDTEGGRLSVEVRGEGGASYAVACFCESSRQLIKSLFWKAVLTT